jgi:hypothetical protein
LSCFQTADQLKCREAISDKDASCFILPFGRVPDVRTLCADVSEPSVISIFTGGLSSYTAYKDGTDRAFRNFGIETTEAEK